MLFLASFSMAYSGYLFICLATRAQGRAFWKQQPGRRSIFVMQLSGFLLLALSALPWIGKEGFAMGFTSWIFCTLPLAALPLIFAWPYIPRVAAAAGIAALPLSLVLLALA